MAVVDPYAPCPCGSGQKFKWCCHKVEPLADRAKRLFDNGQIEAAIQVLDEGLRKEPDNAWLLTRKAMYQIRLRQIEPAKESLRRVLQKTPNHLGALSLLTRLVMMTEEPSEGVQLLQNALAAVPTEERSALGHLVNFVAANLAEANETASAIRHYILALALHAPEESTLRGLTALERNRSLSLWTKNHYDLVPAPEGLPEPLKAQFDQALEWADHGLLSAAAASFEVLSAEKGAALAADRNLGYCRLWLADRTAAIDAFRRVIKQLGETDDAVDLAGLCQVITPLEADDMVEEVQLIWPLRDRDRLLNTLRNDPTVEEGEAGPIDPTDESSPEVEQFGLLDRPKFEKTTDLRIEDIPRFVGRVFVGQEIAGIVAYDDGRLDGLAERFTTLAEGAIPPAHPKTKVLDTVARQALALSWQWRLPTELDAETQSRLEREQGAALIRDVWPKTPLAGLGGRTPEAAAKAGDATVALRATVLQLEVSAAPWRNDVDIASIRTRLGLKPEPEIDPSTVDVDSLHLSRLHLVPVDRLDDAKLAKLYWRTRRFAIDDVFEKAARRLVERPQIWEPENIRVFALFSELALLASVRDQPEEAFEWVRKGRQAEPATQRTAYAPMWDCVEVRIKARALPPEQWVPDLAVVLERYANNNDATQAIMLNLVEMGLIQLTPNPDRPGEVVVDSRGLQYLLAEYGPRVTTASGQLGVSAAKSGIWTPDAATAGGSSSGGIWTPGSAGASSSTPADKPRLIIPGQ